MLTAGLAFLAGLLSTLAPCVLPLIPVMVASAASRHPAGLLALAAGLALSFTTFGLFVATVGFSLGLDDRVLRPVAAVVMLSAGLVLLTPRLQTAFATAAGPVAGWTERRMGRAGNFGPPWLGPLLLGVLLGIVWTPCVGPTLGAALALAATGESLGAVALVMLAFGIGAALPLILVGLLSQAALARWRGRVAGTGRSGRTVLALILATTGVLVLTGLDKHLETWLLGLSPQWLTDLTVRI